MDYDERLKDPNNEYFEDLEKFAFDHLNYYECFRCKEPFFGGLKQCGNNPNLQRNNNPWDQRCGKCEIAD